MSPPAAATPRLLVVDDEPDLRTLYELTLLREGHAVEVAATVAEARQWLHQASFDAVITDMRLPDGSGLDLLRDLQRSGRRERAIVITAYGCTENAVEALKAGAFDYLTKPVELKQFRAVVASALSQGGTPPRLGQPGAQPMAAARDAGAAALARLVGQTPCMRAVKERILKAAPTMAPVLITGESGTGKELVAYAVHANSHRSSGPWLAVNCSAIPENLLEAEFFGVRKGAYTGAQQDREGFFQAARGGTLFLDEIGELPLAMQSKLLRAIQERRVRPLGSTQEEPVDVRIVSATHKDLAQEVQHGRFRQDLFYRINVIDIAIAPLRQRLQDLPLLCQALLERIGQEAGTPTPVLPPGALEHLASLPLAGNVRELENLLYRAVALGEEAWRAPDAPQLPPPPAAAAGGEPMPDAAAPAAGADGAAPGPLQAQLDALERAILLRTLKAHHFNRTAAGQALGLTLRQIRYRMARLGIEPDSADASDD